MTQLSLFAPESPTTPMLAEPPSQSCYSIPTGYTHRIYQAPSHGLYYFRYIINRGHDVVKNLTIPGGNVDNPIAQKRRNLIQSYIDRGSHPDVIIPIIESWQVAKRKRK